MKGSLGQHYQRLHLRPFTWSSFSCHGFYHRQPEKDWGYPITTLHGGCMVI